MRQYITTAIDYPNAAPHMGHVMEKVLADVTARWFRLRGDDVRFQIGTDEHGVKIQRKAQEEKVEPQALVDRNVPLYIDLYRRLQISSDFFIRTTDQKRHWPTVQALWKKLVAAGVLEKRTYTGLYCAGCERFMTARDLTEGKCAIHNAVPEEVSEENYFFLLSKDASWLKSLLTKKKGGPHSEARPSGGYAIVPASRAQETLSLIEQGLEDVSFSRPKSSLSWGIPVPDDPDHVMYVWCDALTNYISGLGYFTDHEENQWWEDAEVTHVIGKDIARFHALIWPAMLKHAGVRIPDRLLIHGFLTSEGQKMSKSIGNVVMPEEVMKHFNGNPDPLRFYLSHEIPVGNDGDFSWKRIDELYDAMLRNKIGNLLNRVLVLLKKEGGMLSAVGKDPAGGAWKAYAAAMDDFRLSDAIQEAVKIAVGANEYIDARRVWALPAAEKTAELSNLAERLRHISLMLLPFIPKTAQEIARQLQVPYAEKMLVKDFQITPEMRKWGGQKDWKKVGEPRILFAPLS
ncbi:MAG: methionine--tRNA ligase [Candidatus Peribacteraceae bacterium]|nr:methionine--tRNA ligase [Candidatus Peribacteraceae bacterium]MDD5742619.1 methionine--tRNA ligase [Candidatus Peribacteraceae bacterium]